jgi:hypothetical protein
MPLALIDVEGKRHALKDLTLQRVRVGGWVEAHRRVLDDPLREPVLPRAKVVVVPACVRDRIEG